MKKFLQWTLAIVLIGLCVVLIIQAIWYGNLDHSLQLAANGFVKDDVTMLTFGQQAAHVCCWLFGVISGLAGLFTIGVASGVMSI